MSRMLTSFALLAALAGAASAQSPAPDNWDPARAELTRAQLDSLLTRYQQGSQSTAYSAAYRSQTRAQTALIRDRLAQGDLQVGDRVDLTVEGQATLTGTFTVEPGRVIVLPGIGDLPLAGVLRSELEQHLTRELARYVVQPVVHAQSLVRISVLGAVGKPGFYVVPASSLVSDALMLAGGPGGNAEMKKLRILRGNQTIWDGAPLQAALVDGLTLDQLSLRAGDEIFLPAPSSGSGVLSAARLFLISIPPLIFALRVLHII